MGSSGGGRFPARHCPAPLSASWMTDLDEAMLQSIICAFQVRRQTRRKGLGLDPAVSDSELIPLAASPIHPPPPIS